MFVQPARPDTAPPAAVRADSSRRDSGRRDPVRREASRRDTARLAPVTVIVTRTPTARDRAPWAVDVLGAAAVRGARATTGIADALAAVPGVYAVDRGNYSVDQRIAVRGVGARANFGLRGVHVLLDGVPQTMPDGQSQLTNVDPAAIGRVEVLRGAAASLYGNASGGVLAFTTDLGAPARGVGTGARLEGGAFGARKAQLRAATVEGTTVAAVSASDFAIDNFRQHAAAEQRRLTLAADHAFDAATTGTFRFYAGSDPRAQNPGALTAAEYAARRDSAAGVNILRGADKRVSQDQLAFGLRRAGDDGSRAEATVYGLLRDTWNPLATPPPTSGASGALPLNAGTLTTIYRHAGGARAAATRPLGFLLPAGADPARAPRLTVGAEVQAMRDLRKNARDTGGRLVSRADTTFVDQVETVTNLAPFAQLTWAPSARWLVDAGARYDRVRFAVADRFLADGVDNSGARTMAAASGHLGASVALAPALVPYANVSTDFDTPTTTELQAQPGNGGGFSPDLGPQRSVGGEAGARGVLSDGAGGPRATLRYSASLYALDTRDAIVQWQEVNGRAYFRNAGRVRSRGAEFGLGARAPLGAAADALGLDVAYTLGRARFADYRVVTGARTDTLTGRTLPGAPERFVRVGVRARPFAGAVGPLAPLALEAEHTWASRLYADDRNTLRVGDWGRGVLDLRARWDAPSGAAAVRPFVALRNASDQRYVGSVTVNGTGGRVLEPAPGRTLYVGTDVGWAGR